MITLVALGLALTVLPTTWGVVLVVGAALVDIAETVVLVRWSRRRRAAVGSETFLGKTAVVVQGVSAQDGQVRIDGELWRARAQDSIPRGAAVIVVGIDGLVLEVESVEAVAAR
jgi:membrane-bound serine protease (ClpP class)